MGRVRAMIEELTDMPPSTLGLRAGGTITSGEYRDHVVKPVHERLERGDRINVLFVTDPDFKGLDMGALWEDTKAAGSFGLRHLSNWGRVAIVTDNQWLRHGVSAFGRLSPGELRLFDADEFDAAKEWLAGA